MSAPANQVFNRQPYQLPNFSSTPNLPNTSVNRAQLPSAINFQGFPDSGNLQRFSPTVPTEFDFLSGFDDKGFDRSGLNRGGFDRQGFDAEGNRFNPNPNQSTLNQTIIPGLDALSGLTQAYTGLQQLDLSRDAFDFNKGLSLANLGNQATLLDERRANIQRFVGEGANRTQDEIQQSIDSLPSLQRTV